jgi:hypothetical protein
MFNWINDGQDHIFQQWFWHRVGDTDPETPLHTLQLFSADASLDVISQPPRRQR